MEFPRASSLDPHDTQEGDLVLTGTPSGIGPLKDGDQIECLLSDADGKELATLNFGAEGRVGGYNYQP